MKPRYATGSGKAPTNLTWINHKPGNRGELVFSGPSRDRKVAFQSKDELCSLLQRLIAQSVPLSIGGQAPGAVDEVAMLIETGELYGTYIEISWSSPDDWTVREMAKGALEWDQVSSPDMIANVAFNVDTLKRVD